MRRHSRNKTQKTKSSSILRQGSAYSRSHPQQRVLTKTRLLEANRSQAAKGARLWLKRTCRYRYHVTMLALREMLISRRQFTTIENAWRAVLRPKQLFEACENTSDDNRKLDKGTLIALKICNDQL